MLEPLNQFICDYCDQIIQQPEQGWIEWLMDRADRKKYGFKVVHHAAYSPLRTEGERNKNCYHYARHPGRMDDHLDHFLNNRIANLLSFLDVGPYLEPEYSSPSVKDLREFVEIMRRLAIPYYEEARLYWSLAAYDGYFEGASESWLYLESTLKDIISTYGEAGNM